MTLVRRVALTLLAGGTVAIAPATPAFGHSGAGGNFTSNYRTLLTEVPEIDGLEVKVIDIDGTVEVTWTGSGAIVVTGYENEPYLRIDRSGVFENQRSPATFLNQDRFATVVPPESVDSAAPPEWRRSSNSSTARWHDHRTHWMSSKPPIQVQQDPTRQHVITDRWEIPFRVGGRSAVIAGTLTWTPPPPLRPWVAAVVATCLVTIALLWTRLQAVVAAGAALIGTTAFVIDTAGYVAESSGGALSVLWAFAYPAAAAWATALLVIGARHEVREPQVAMIVVGILLTLLGGIDRIDVITSSEVFSALPATWARAAAVANLGLGSAMAIRFVSFVAVLFLARSPARSLDQEPNPI